MSNLYLDFMRSKLENEKQCSPKWDFQLGNLKVPEAPTVHYSNMTATGKKYIFKDI